MPFLFEFECGQLIQHVSDTQMCYCFVSKDSRTGLEKYVLVLLQVFWILRMFFDPISKKDVTKRHQV